MCISFSGGQVHKLSHACAWVSYLVILLMHEYPPPAQRIDFLAQKHQINLAIWLFGPRTARNCAEGLECHTLTFTLDNEVVGSPHTGLGFLSLLYTAQVISIGIRVIGLIYPRKDTATVRKCVKKRKGDWELHSITRSGTAMLADTCFL